MTTHVRAEDLLEPPADANEHLETCAVCRARREAQLGIRNALRSLPREAEVPPRVLSLLDAERSRRSGRRRMARYAAVAAAVAIVAAAAAAVVHRRRAAVPAALADELALDHLHYAHRVDAAEVRGDSTAISAYFAGKLGFEPHYGEIEAATFEGAKPCRIAGRWTALVWLDRAGHWLSLFAMPEHPLRERGCVSAEGVRVCGAPDPRGGARVLVGDLSEREMLRLIDESLQ